MAEKCSFFNSISGDRKYKAEDWAAYFASFVSNGVLLRNGTLAVSAGGGNMGVSVGTGAAFVNGYRYENTAALPLTIQTAHASLPRIDRVVLRWSREQRDISAAVITGTAATEPTAPDIFRTVENYDICLAEIKVGGGVTSIAQSAVTDKRMDNSVCGIATMIGDLTTTDLYQQIQGDLAEFKAGAESDFDTFQAQAEADFNDWFAGVQNTLGDNAAGNLANLINNKVKHTTVGLTLNGWAGTASPYTQTVTVLGMTSALDVVCSPAPASFEAYCKAQVRATAQGEAALTFTAKKKPTEALNVNLLIMTGVNA